MKTENPPEPVMPTWKPQLGPQTEFVESQVFEVIYGGARGGGKTDAALGEFAIHAAKYGESARGLLVRRTRVALEPTIARARQIFVDAQWAEQKSRFTWPNGARLSFRHLDNDSHADAYQGHDYTRLYIEELTQFASPRLVDKLDLSALTAPDYAGDFVNAFKIGEGLAARRGPSGPVLDQFTNAVTGQLQVPDGPLRDQAARRAELLGALGVGLSGLPYAQRIPILNHLAPGLAQEGIPSHVVIGFDPTDEALASSIAQAQTAGDSLNR